MKIKFWMAAWCAILAVCVAKGIVTRASFTTLSADSSEILSSYYEYSVDQIVRPELFSHTTYAALASQSKLIVLCRFTGKRRIKNGYLLSQVQVLDVIKGKQALKNQKINIDEPVSTRLDPISYHNLASDFTQMVRKFGWQGKNRVIVSQHSDLQNNLMNYAIMGSNRDYLLFLSLPELLPGQKAEATGYQLLDNPYAKLTVSATNAATYTPPTETISFDQAMQYEIFLNDPPAIRSYFQTKMIFLEQLHLL